MTKAERLIKVIEDHYEELIDHALDDFRDSIVPNTCYQGWETGTIIDLNGQIRPFYWSPGTTTEGILNGDEVVAIKFIADPVYPGEDDESDEEEFYDIYVDYYGRDAAEQSLEHTIENLKIDAENEKEQEIEQRYNC